MKKPLFDMYDRRLAIENKTATGGMVNLEIAKLRLYKSLEDTWLFKSIQSLINV